MMSTDVTSIRLPHKDAMVIEHFVGSGEFKSKSEFIRYAIKKTMNEIILQEFHEKMTEPIKKKDMDKIQKEIKEIRKELWDEYAQHIS